jgi:uncharacterized protein YecE (DUF72 family)
MIRIGTSGWIYKHWRDVFYPPGLPVRLWFDHYRQHFDTVELNNSFYRLPSPEMFSQWRKQAPEGFIYAVKASRYITHMKKLSEPESALQKFFPRVKRLGPRLGPVLYQLPPFWRCNAARLRSFVALLPRGFQHVFEFREPSWYCDEVREILSEAGVSFCMHDSRGQPCPEWITGSLVYVRFHGPHEQAYTGHYPLKHLRAWARRIDEYQGRGLDVYAYFNNDAAGHAVTNARELQRLLHITPYGRQQAAAG